MARLRFHQGAVDLLPRQPSVSADCARELDAREQELGIRIPASVREWYVLEDSVNLWGRYSNDDDPVPLNELGAVVDFVDPPRDLAREGLVMILRENQGVCTWAVRLDGSEDPPVVVEVDSWPNPVWVSCADRFSTFMFCWLWDFCFGPLDLRGRHSLLECQAGQLAPEAIAQLQAHFQEMPRTHGWPGKTNYRFSGHGGKILIWAGEERGTDWHVAASSKDMGGVTAKLRALGISLEGAYVIDNP